MFERLRRLTGKKNNKSIAPNPVDDQGDHLTLAAEIPIGQDQPLWRVQLQMITEPHADGERLRLRAHVQTNFASALRPALQAANPSRIERPALSHGSKNTALTLAQRAGGLAQRMTAQALKIPAIRTMAEPLLKLDLNTWIEIQASTASLAEGSHDLLPQQDKLAALGIRPKRAEDQPMAESWAGEVGDGFAQVSVLQIDKKHLPASLRKSLGTQAFSLAAAIVNTAQQR